MRYFVVQQSEKCRIPLLLSLGTRRPVAGICLRALGSRTRAAGGLPRGQHAGDQSARQGSPATDVHLFLTLFKLRGLFFNNISAHNPKPKYKFIEVRCVQFWSLLLVGRRVDLVDDREHDLLPQAQRGHLSKPSDFAVFKT